MKNVMLYRLITGELILAEEWDDDEGEGYTYLLKNPVKIVVIPSRADPQNPTVGLAHWNEFSEDKLVSVRAEHVITRTTPIQQFVDQYKQMFGKILMPQGSGLVLPS